MRYDTSDTSRLSNLGLTMLFGYNTNGFAHHRLEDALAILAGIGYRSVAITLDYHALNPFDADLPRQLAAVRGLLRQYDLRCVIETGSRFLLDPWRKHQPTLVSASESERGVRLDFLKRAVNIAQDLEADAVSFWSGTAQENTDAALNRTRLINGCRELADYAAERKVRLAFEPEPGMFIDRMERFAELYERVNHASFGLTLDIGHLHCQGEAPIEAHLRRWRDRLWNIHIEDMRLGVHEHLMFGEGEIDFVPILRTLVDIGYIGGLHVELSRHSHNAIETARSALGFLQGLFKCHERFLPENVSDTRRSGYDGLKEDWR